MTAYHVTITLHATPAEHAEVRLFIDPRPAGGLGTETEIELVRDADAWNGRFSVASSSAFTYRVGMRTHVGTPWTIAIRRAGRAQTLLSDADILTLPKEWLVGTCEQSTPRKPRITPAKKRKPQSVLQLQ